MAACRTEFNQTATATGRLSSTTPSANIPVRGELGRRIRRAFIAKSDAYVLLAADYSQIELRVMAHLSGDEGLRRAFCAVAGHSRLHRASNLRYRTRRAGRS